MRFGISTHLYHGRRLERDHLVQIAAHGFESVELFATRSHFDYHQDEAVGRFAQWLTETGLTLHGIHAPITALFGSEDPAVAFSNAVDDNGRREAAVRETQIALRAVIKHIRFDTMVVHLGAASSKNTPGENSRAAAIRSLDQICRVAAPLGVRVAVEIIPNRLSDAASLVSLIEREVDSSDVGICMDFGHAHLMGDLPDAIETAAEHLITTHVHDNHGRTDDHLVPYLGSIGWDSALITMQKIGYAGTYVLELGDTGSPAAVLEEARRARQRLEQTLAYP